MGLNKAKNTFHGQDRSKERTHLKKHARETLIKEASRYGKCWANLRPGPLQEYLFYKSQKKKAKVFQNYIFIFQKTSTSLITMYQIPENILQAQKEYDELVASKIDNNN